MITGSRVLVTGGTGSLGRELARVLVDADNEVVVYSRNEERQYEMQKSLAGRRVEFFIGDVRDQSTLEYALSGCDVAIHAAAMKDLIMCERQPTQTVLNNITGSISFIQAVKNSRSVKRACGVSTDKAASPSSVYGCTKYVMEQLFHEAGRFSECVFSAARFGNMINSTGSLIGHWKANPRADIKLTHPEVARFFFTVNDAARTVIESIERATNGDIMIKKMKAARIYDILRLITGRTEFEIMGLFPGEKIHEELVSPNEVSYCHDQGDYYAIRPSVQNPTPPSMFSTANAVRFTDEELSALIGL